MPTNELFVAELLEAVADGRVEASAALEQWPAKMKREGLVDAAWNVLFRHQATAELRETDRAFAKQQIEQLREWAAMLRNKFGA
jgi:hypothetical protein